MSNAHIKTARHSLERGNRSDLLGQLGAGRDGNMRDQFEGWRWRRLMNEIILWGESGGFRDR